MIFNNGTHRKENHSMNMRESNVPESGPAGERNNRRVKFVIAVLVLMATAPGCQTPSERLMTASQNGGYAEVAALVSKSSVTQGDVGKALRIAVESGNHSAAAALISHLQQNKLMDILQRIPEGYVLEYDGEFTAARDRAEHKLGDVAGFRAVFAMSGETAMLVYTEEQIAKMQRHEHMFPKMKSPDQLDSATYYELLLKPSPGLLGIALGKGDAEMAALLLDAGVPYAYTFYVDSSPLLENLNGDTLRSAGVYMVSLLLSPRTIHQIFISGRCAMANFEGSRAPGVFYEPGTHAGMARKHGLAELAQRMENRQETIQAGGSKP
jgi:hypothetical protein